LLPVCLLAGMKVVGVATSLTPQEVAAQHPDVVRASISQISVSDLVNAGVAATQ
jgi:hypothetical protein